MIYHVLAQNTISQRRFRISFLASDSAIGTNLTLRMERNAQPRLFRKTIARRTTMGSTSDRITGKTNEVAGKARQAVGKAVDNHEEQVKGSVQEAKGKAQVAKGEAKDAVKKVIDKA
jgi:uncharacterized protein YjbJ (UPF0337 family)